MATVCNIDSILKLRIIFGFYYETGASIKIRLLSKLYCSLVVVTILYFRFHNKSRYLLFQTFASTEYISYFLVSLFTGENYIVKYYGHIAVVDGSSYANKLYRRLEKILLLTIGMNVVVRFAVKAVCYHLYENYCLDKNILEVVFGSLFAIAVDTGRFVIVMILTLLFCRVKAMHRTLLERGFDNSPQYRLTPRKYIHWYETLVDTFRATDNPLNFLAILSQIICLSRTTIYMLDSIPKFKENGFGVADLLELIVVSQPTLTLFVIAVITDLTSQYLDDILSICVSKRTESNNERERGDIKLLVMLLENVALRSNMARLTSLSVRQFLAFFSFWFTTFLAMLQIKNLN